MPNLIGLGAGAAATALTLVFGAAFWPPMEKAPAAGKSAVLQPVFVVSSAPARSAASPAAVAAATPTPTPASGNADSAAMAKLAVALQNGSTTVPVGAGATRGISFSPANGLSPPVSEAARRLCAQGLVAMAAGDIAGARLYLERAAEAGDARALMVLAQSYDPTTLARIGTIGIKGDAGKAREYYSKALAAGMGAARERMAALEAD